jgi:hypothetical protein
MTHTNKSMNVYTVKLASASWQEITEAFAKARLLESKKPSAKPAYPKQRSWRHCNW